MFLCDGSSRLKIKIAPDAKVKAFLKKTVQPFVRSRGAGNLSKLNVSVIYSGFKRGSGTNSTPTFGSLFANTVSNFPSFAPKIIKVSGNIKVLSSELLIRRSPTNLPTQLININSPAIISGGWDAIPSSVYDPPDSNNSVLVISRGPQCIWNLKLSRLSTRFELKASLNRPINNFRTRISGSGIVKSKYFEKLHGHFNKINQFDNFTPTQKLFPIQDITVEHNNIFLVNEKIKPVNLFESINEGVCVGNITKNSRIGNIISDDDSTYITPSSIYTKGTFKYKCFVNTPEITPLESFFFFRAAAPTFNYETDQPTLYDITNIKFEDPSGNLIVKYKDFQVRGEANFEDKDQFNYITYVSEPEINYATLNTWKLKYPILGEPSGYTLSFDITGDCFYKPFTEEFAKGFAFEANLNDQFVNTSENDYLAVDGAPLSAQSQDYHIRPTNAIRISAIEIANLGRAEGILRDSELPFFLGVQSTGTWIERVIYPTKVLLNTFDNNIYPTGLNNVWETSPDLDNLTYNNTINDDKHQLELIDRLTNLYTDGNIVSHTAPSGKLQLLYEHQRPFSVKLPRGGDFSFGNTYTNPFKKADIELVYGDDSFFIIEDISLEIVAKKAIGTNDFPIDVVGYSDDKVLFITSDVGGFLQNSITGSGTIPTTSGFGPVYDLGISSESLSDKRSYFSKNIVPNDSGDHYLITQSPLVNSTSFTKYTVPLKIYKDKVELGMSKDYSMSSYFESLYLDIYPIPSGASIASANLIVKYKPGGALPLSTAGFLSREIARRQNRLYPSARKSVDTPYNILNSPLSLIENIPHAYSTSETTLKTNYARRWRGCSGNVFGGPFDPVPFDFAFSNPQLDQPFTIGYYDFNNTHNNYVLSSLEDAPSTVSGLFTANLSSSLVRNLGLRFNNESLFPIAIRDYTSLDWADNSHELYGKILDSFDSAVRISGVNGYLNFGNVPTSSGFAVFLRFSPDYNMSGVDYNLWNSGVLFSKWDEAEELEYALGYKDGYLSAYAKDSNGNLIELQDSISYENYQYPLSIALTYNDNQSRKLRLFTNSEIAAIASGTNILRDESNEFVLSSGNSDLLFGYSSGSGIGINAFISEIGISTHNDTGGGNLVYNANPDSSKQQDNIELFFDTHLAHFCNVNDSHVNDRNKLWQFIDEKTEDWKLGAFKYCSFGVAYDIMKFRNGKDYLYHNFYNDGKTYQDRTNLTLPNSIHLSGISYHSQVENDMLRFSLSGNEDRLYSLPPRLVKNLPRSYIVAEDSLIVNSVVQHECDSTINWPNGKTGAKLIVSLYTPSKESVLFPTKNFGLISRSTHYLNPKDCWNKIESKFKLGDLKDNESEPWAFFDKTITYKEFEENYFVKDINQMFVQYDVIYPSGTYNKSQIKLHSVDIELNGINQSDEINNNLPIYESGKAYQEAPLPLYEVGYVSAFNNQINIYTSGVTYIEQSGIMSLISSGVFNSNVSMPLYTIQVGNASTSNSNFGSLFGNNNPLGMSLFVEGGYDNEEDSIICYVNGLVENTISNSLNLFSYDDVNQPAVDQLNFMLLAGFPLSAFDISTEESIGLYVLGPNRTWEPTSANIALYINSRPKEENINSQFPLYLYHVKPISKRDNELESFKWDGTNFGKEISLLDNQFASVPAIDEIRGVQTICYGNCDTISTIKCQEDQLITHDTLWYDPECVNGGVIRPITVYTNPDVGAFGTNIPYSGHFYGIRKFSNLIPQAPYTITITGKTGTDKILQVPREMTEWEYGTNEDVAYSGIQLTPSVNSSGNKFGKSVTVLDDRVMIGCPYENIFDETNYEINNAGKIYVYRKNPEPSGYDWSNQLDKSNFVLEQEIVLPTGWRRDYFYKRNISFRDRYGNLLPYTGIGTNWIVGQEGRQLGYSLDSARRNNTDVLIAGGPGAEWSRTFAPIQTTPVTIGLFVFNNELVSDPDNANWRQILDQLSDRDLVYRYFCDPSVKFDIKVILCEPMLGSNIGIGETSKDFLEPKPPFVSKYLTHRHFSYNVNTPEYQEREDVILQELKDIFHEVFPLTSGAIHSGIPPLLGIYIDNSRSLGSKSLGYNIPFRKGALDKFIDYYKDYSKNNGLMDFDGDPAEGFVNVTVDVDENWIAQSINCLLDLTDIETLQENNVQKLIANNLGSFNENAGEFNYPPPSGGSVYIFERENNGQFKVVQEIKSPVSYTNDTSDRFGHDVAISDDGKVIAIGSPYSPHSVQVFEYNENFNNQLLNSLYFITSFLQPRYYEEINNATFGESYDLYSEYLEKLPITESIANLNLETYNKFSEGLRFAYFKFLENLQIKRYNLIYEMGVPIGFDAWSDLWANYIPTPRLGYSVDINSDGSLIAIGSPTDSLGERDYTQTWFRYDIKSGQETAFGGEPWQWQNYTNAGAIRLLESRNYYPHNKKVVEYYKFGNLHELLSPPQDSGLFSFTMNNLYNSMGYTFSRTSFAEGLKIPEDVGLAFIITPAINAASDEIIDNIRDWLSLGDRHLVLVGNDPKWEANGAYFNSNNIINYILEELDVNMRIYAARNQYEALMQNTNTFYNVQNSFVPAKSTPAIAYPVPLRGSGVGDIRLYDTNISDLYICDKPPSGSSDPFSFDFERKRTYRELHDKCEMPIVHEGDLRSKYIDQCEIMTPRGPAWISYERNFGFQYGTHNIVDWGCEGEERGKNPNFNTKSEPVPILSAYEAIPKTIIVPGSPPTEELRSKLVGYDSSTSVRTTFGNAAYSGVAFIWSNDDSNYTELNYNINNTVSNSLFFDPSEYNGNDAVLQARSTISNQSATKLINIKPNVCMIASEQYSTTSKIVLIAATMYESRNILLSSAGDRNINLYFNLLATDADGNAKVAQVGGFTNRTSYTDGYNKSDIQAQLTNVGIDMGDLNVLTQDLYDISKGYTAAWIANTDNMPSSEDIQNIKRFLDMGNKTLIITYGQEPSLGDEISNNTTYTYNLDSSSMTSTISAYNVRSANVAKYICEQLGLSMGPLFLEGKNKYADRSDIRTDNIGQLTSSLSIAANTYLYDGLDENSSFASSNSYVGYGDGAVTVPYSDRPPYPVPNGFTHEFVPINNNNAINLAFFDAPVTDTEQFSIGVPKFNTGITKVSFTVPEKLEEHDDYNLFKLRFNILKESSLEISPINLVVGNCLASEFVNTSVLNQPIGPVGRNILLVDTDENNNVKQTYVSAGYTKELYDSLDLYVQIPSGQETLDMYFTHSASYPLQQNPKQLRTVRLLSVSGVRIPSNTIISTARWPIYETEVVTIPGTPDTSYTQLFNREISTDSSKYCISNNRICSNDPPEGYGTPGVDIADGPVVMAQTVYHQGGYFNGYNKSRITVISDPSLIQGRTILSEGGNTINPNLAWFLASLYPNTNFNTTRSGRQYETAFKIISPERSSPSRLVNAYPENSGLNYRFGQFTSNSLPATKYSDLEGKIEIAGKKPPQPTDPMLSLFNSDIGHFRIEIIPPPAYSEEYKAALRQAWYIDNFNAVEQHYGSTSKIQDTYNGTLYRDAGIYSRIPPILRAIGKDHLDLDVFYSGYPGDLFGYSVKIHKDKVYVGAPFSPYNTEEITPWSTIIASGMQYGKEVGFNGGAGAVYLIEKVGNVGSGLGSVNLSKQKTTGIPWTVTRKFRPEEISVGFSGLTTSNSSTVIGNNNYSNDELKNLAFVSDMFGYDIALNGDILAISAPCHRFENYSEDTLAPFIRKEFNEQFDIQQRIIHDLAIPSEREQYGASGTVVFNHGAVFTYENKINNWGSKTQEWTPIHKLVAQGPYARIQNSGENTFFGNAIAIDRARRVDGDYILAVGAMNHPFSTSGNVFDNIGSTYAFDGMLRSLRPAFSHPDTFIAGRVYGEYQKPSDYTTFTFKNDNNFDQKVLFNGIVLSNINGEIFIEASGQDKVPRGYVVHRPYIEHIRGSFLHGTPVYEDINLFVDGAPPFVSGSLSLVNYGPESNNVYNMMDLYTFNLLQSSGNMPLIASGLASPSGVMELYSSGIAKTDTILQLRTRGSL